MTALLALLACGPAGWDAFEEARIEAVCERTFACYDADELLSEDEFGIGLPAFNAAMSALICSGGISPDPRAATVDRRWAVNAASRAAV